MKSVLEKTKAAIYKFQNNIARYYNRCHISALILSPSNKICLDSVDIIYFSAKLAYQYLDLYTVKKQISLTLYRLKLLLFIKRLYLVFNIVKLTITVRNLLSGLSYFLFFLSLMIFLFFYSLVFLFSSLSLVQGCDCYKCHI